MALSGNVTVINPDTYLNYLSPEAGRDFEFGRNVLLVVLGATLWDILVYIPDDLRIIRRNPLQFTNFAFIFSRLCAAGYILTNAIARTSSVENPHPLSSAIGWLCSLSASLSQFLFLRRVHAIYAGNRMVQWTFSVLWALYAGSSITVPLGVTPIFIPGTHYFNQAIIKPTIYLSAFSALFFDSCVFVAVSYRLASPYGSTEERLSWRTLVSGRALPGLTRAVLHGGQQYYLIALVSTVTASATLFSPQVPIPVKAVFSTPLVPLIASMASRVFRNLKLFDYSVPTTRNASDIEFAMAGPTTPSVLVKGGLESDPSSCRS